MQFKFAPLFVGVMALMIGSITATTSDHPAPPGLKYLYSANLTAGASYKIGLGPRGNRTVVPLTGGSVSGPYFSGNVLPVGADYFLTDANPLGKGAGTPDVRQTLQLDDGAYILVFESGSTQTDGTVHIRLKFETGSEKYYWVNTVVAVGILRLKSETELSIDAWQVLSPDN